MDCHNKNQTKQLHIHIHLHKQQLVASIWLGDHQGRPSAPIAYKIYVDDLHMARNQFIITITTKNYL